MADVVRLCCCCWFLLVYQDLSISKKRQFDSDVSTPSIHESWRPTRTRSGKLPHHGTKRHHYKVWTTYVASYKTHPNALQSELPDSFPYVQGLMEEVIEGIMEEAQVMSRTLGAVYAEYRLHYGRFSGVCSHLEVCWCPTISTKGLQQCTSHSTRRILWMAEDEECRHSHPPHLASPKWMADVDQEPGRTTIADSQWSTETTHQYDINCAKCYWIQLLRWKNSLLSGALWHSPRRRWCRHSTTSVPDPDHHGEHRQRLALWHRFQILLFRPFLTSPLWADLRVQMQQCKLFAPFGGRVCENT